MRTESVVCNDLDGRREENGKPSGLTRQDDTTRLKELASEQERGGWASRRPDTPQED